ncbi:MAG: hypothetical protein KDC79_09770 [Cyclobacteriaceae bacterium]|nr:hypothetical protein [Cyclobacteriaceae bacterium]
MKKLQLIALIVSTILMLIVVPYTIIEWFDKSIPFSNNLLAISGITVILFAYNLYNYRRSQKEENN